MHRPQLTATIMLVFLASFTGCNGGSGPTGTIAGKLTIDGKAPPKGTQLQFMSPNGASGGEVSSDGSFTIMGVPVGSYKVMVTAGAGSAASGEMNPEDAMKMSSGTSPGGKGNPDAFGGDSSIPTKYTSIDTSGVTFEVKEGSNDFVLDMKE